MTKSKTTPEGKVKEKVDALLTQHHAEWLNPATWGMGESGKSDKVACVYGHYVAIEAKAGKNGPTELQRKALRATVAAGGSACVINEETLADLAVMLGRLRIDAEHGYRSAQTVIQPPHVNIFQDVVSINPEDYEE